MRAAGGPEVLEVGDYVCPEPGPGQVKISVRAAGLNRADILQRRGNYPAPQGTPQDILGLEFAGEVAEVGAGVEPTLQGKRVMGLVPGGAMATHILTFADELLEIPDNITVEEAAALPEACFTAFDALTQGAACAGSTVLIHAIGSGVGTVALQIAKLLQCDVVGTSRTKSKLENANALGSFVPIHVEKDQFAKKVMLATAEQGANTILDFVGGSYFEENMRSLAYRGHLIVIGLVGGLETHLNLGGLLAKRATIRGTVLRSRPAEERKELCKQFRKKVLPWIAVGEINPVIADIMDMNNIADAHSRLESNKVFGKIVLRW